MIFQHISCHCYYVFDCCKSDDFIKLAYFTFFIDLSSLNDDFHFLDEQTIGEGRKNMSDSKGCALNDTKLLIDTDPGTDDCHALTHLLTLGNVIAITTVFGNSIQPQTSRNACRILEMLGMNDIPVYNGAHCSLQADYHIGNDSPQTLCHCGSDGMNDVPHIIPSNVVKQPETSMSAPDAIINKVMENPGKIILVALGPLTNIAIATKICP
jgi:hypothetical protein